jgi:hypothetical protein
LKKKIENFFGTGLEPAHSFWAGNSGALSTVHAEQWRRCSEEEKKKEEGRACGGFKEVLLAVSDRRTAWTVAGFSSSSPRLFFCSVLLCFCFFSVFLLLAASVSCLSFLLVFLMVAAVVGGAMVVPAGDAAVCFLLPRAEAQASVSLYFSSSHFSASSSIFGR